MSVINQLDAQNFCFTISLFHASTCFEHMCSSSGGQNCITQPLVSSNLQTTFSCTRRPPIGVMIAEADDEHMCSKHVEAWNILTVKQKCCASSWLITEINKLPNLCPPGMECFLSAENGWKSFDDDFSWYNQSCVVLYTPSSLPRKFIYWLKLNSVALVRERTIPTERPPPVDEVSAYFCG